METRGPSIVFKTHKSLLARDTRLLADGIVDVRTMRGEHFTIYVLLASAIDSSSFIYDSLVRRLLL